MNQDLGCSVVSSTESLESSIASIAVRTDELYYNADYLVLRSSGFLFKPFSDYCLFLMSENCEVWYFISFICGVCILYLMMVRIIVLIYA